MTSFELSLLLQTILDSTEYAKAPRDFATYLDSQYSAVSRVGIAIVSGDVLGSNIPERIAKLDAPLKEVMQKVTSEKPAQMFVSLDRWLTELRRANDLVHRLELIEPSDGFAPADPVDGTVAREALDPLIERVKIFHDMYENLLQSHTRRNLLILIFSAHELVIVAQATELLVTSINKALRFVTSPKEGFKDLSILFPAEATLDTLIQKLSALEGLYEELCRLLDVSINEYPLELIKVESGSLWIKLFGESRVISLMSKFVESAASYLYRNFTKEGKIVAIPQTVEVIDSMLKLSDSLEQSGIDSSVLKENIKQSSIILAQRLNQLLAGEPAVNINGRNYSVGDEWEQRFLRESRTLFIGSGNDEEKTENKQ